MKKQDVVICNKPTGTTTKYKKYIVLEVKYINTNFPKIVVINDHQRKINVSASRFSLK